MGASLEFRQKILEQLPHNRTAGHLGRDKTISSVKQRYYWVGLNSDLQPVLTMRSMYKAKKNGLGVGTSEGQSSKIGFPLEIIEIDIASALRQPQMVMNKQWLLVISLSGKRSLLCQITVRVQSQIKSALIFV